MNPHVVDRKTLARLLGVSCSTLQIAQALPQSEQPAYLCHAFAALSFALERITPASLFPTDLEQQKQLFDEIAATIGWDARTCRYWWNAHNRGRLYMKKWYQLVTACIHGGYAPAALPEPFTRAYRMHDSGMRLSYAEKRPTAQRSKYRNYYPVLIDGKIVYRRK
jgi:hypothetical protein